MSANDSNIVRFLKHTGWLLDDAIDDVTDLLRNESLSTMPDEDELVEGSTESKFNLVCDTWAYIKKKLVY